MLQAYKNYSKKPIEAKYVFPLDDMAAGKSTGYACKSLYWGYVSLCVVCGFEAFINGKHIVGEVKEKEQAHREYREAISQGHGAYLMDEETPVSIYAKQKHPGCKKSARPIRSSIANRYVRPKTLISVEAKKLLIKNLFTT